VEGKRVEEGRMDHKATKAKDEAKKIKISLLRAIRREVARAIG